MTYSSFASDVLCRGAHFACSYAASLGVSGRLQAIWLARLSLKSQRSA